MRTSLWSLVVCSSLASGAPYKLVPVVKGLDKPVGVTADLKQDRLLVLEQKGRVMAFGAGKLTVMLDLQKKVTSSCNECGLLGIALHPKYATNGRYFLNYTTRRPDLTSVISEFSADGTERELMHFRQPYSNHNGGGLAFGPDGFLYIGTGDGGYFGDPLKAGQDKNTVLAKMLRIDVDGAKPYGVPADNPFAKGGGLKEIYAWGLRNPWRFSFDPKTGTLFVGDVGQNEWEEISVVEKGKNYGWNIMEANHCYQPEKNCPREGLEKAVVEYDHSQGNSVTGGYVYRGKKIPALDGVYVYGDFGSGKIWGLSYDYAAKKAKKNELLVESEMLISSFGVDRDGELLVVEHRGSVHRLAKGK